MLGYQWSIELLGSNNIFIAFYFRVRIVRNPQILCSYTSCLPWKFWYFNDYIFCLFHFRLWTCFISATNLVEVWLSWNVSEKERKHKHVDENWNATQRCIPKLVAYYVSCEMSFKWCGSICYNILVNPNWYKNTGSNF